MVSYRTLHKTYYRGSPCNVPNILYKNFGQFHSQEYSTEDTNVLYILHYIYTKILMVNDSESLLLGDFNILLKTENR